MGCGGGAGLLGCVCSWHGGGLSSGLAVVVEGLRCRLSRRGVGGVRGVRGVCSRGLCVRRAGAPGPAACGPALFSRLVPLCVFCASLCCVAAVALLAGESSVLLGVCFLPCAVWALRVPCFPCGVVLVSHYGQFRGAYFLCNSARSDEAACDQAVAACFIRS